MLRKHPLFARVLAAAASVRAALALIVLLALASALGAVLPQSPTTPNAEEIYRSYGPFWHALIRALRLGDVFHSAWFMALVSLFAGNLVLCTGRRLRRHLRRPDASSDSVTEDRTPSGVLTVSFSGIEPDEAEERVARALRRSHYRVRRVGGHLIAERWRWSRLAPDLVHISLLVILAGALLGLFREEGAATVSEEELGRSFPVKVTGSAAAVGAARFSLKVQDFGADVYPGTALYRDYWTDLTVTAEDGSSESALVRVNHPLAFHGYGFYQTGYGDDLRAATIRLAVLERSTNTAIAAVPLRVGESARIELAGLEVRFTRFFTNLRLTEEGTPFNVAGPQALNPAAVLEVLPQGAGAAGGSYRDVAFADLFSPHGNADRPFAFYLESFSVPKFVEIRCARDPGYLWAWAGFVLLVAGLGGSFYLRPQRVTVTVEPDSRDIRLREEATGLAFRGAARSERLRRTLEDALKGGT